MENEVKMGALLVNRLISNALISFPELSISNGISSMLTKAIVFVALTLGALHGCSNRSSRTEQLHFKVSKSFEGEITVLNVSGSGNPVIRPDGVIEMKINPGIENHYDHSKFPKIFHATGSLENGDAVSVSSVANNANLELSVVSIDDRSNLRLKMVNLKNRGG